MAASSVFLQYAYLLAYINIYTIIYYRSSRMSRVGLHILSIIGIINIKYTGYAIRFKDDFSFKIEVFSSLTSGTAA
ncbi:hypothetical protein CLOSTASPAR_02277 [[Clostridium] asparagiforme DSM 15981]|uniref:Uncharacterized protein n=1 Tax=[Clostridium] asparagiforme DSM 15981 TaxID=518636 RepID=C0CZ49_9FIRM|nr:hypothetical protein CLOSTASPAR_02277 [[Clostridium] asparagiforme DSM 15981]